MRPFMLVSAGAVGGALLGVALVLAMARHGLVPINDAQMRNYLMRHADILPAMMNRAQAMEDEKQKIAQNAAMKKIGQAAFFDPAIAFVTGPADAKNSLVEFYDYDCPYCRASVPAVKKFYEAHKNDTRFSFIEFPIKQLHGESAILAAKASLAARRHTRFIPHRVLAIDRDAFELTHGVLPAIGPLVEQQTARQGRLHGLRGFE